MDFQPRLIVKTNRFANRAVQEPWWRVIPIWLVKTYVARIKAI